MKSFILYSLVIAAVLTIISAPHFLKNGLKDTPIAPREPALAEATKAEAAAPEPAGEKILPPEQVIAPVVKSPAPPKPAAAPRPDPALSRWNRMARTFEQQQELLARETDPEKRLALIRVMSGYVRFDTLSAIDWAMYLQDPAEQQAAIEAISDKALVGIGAKIQVDETGFPRIRETTIMSAIAATGEVESGDYIVGMDDGTGEPVYFEGLPAREVAQHLRGQAGSEIRLFITKIPGTGSSPQTFDVPLRRSLIVVQPPY